MDKELVALQGLLKRAKLLPRSVAPPVEKKYASAPPPSEAPSSAAKRTATLLPKAAYHQTQITAPAANSKQQQQQLPVQRATAKNPIAPEVPTKATEVLKKWQLEEDKERARAAEREEFRQMLQEMEKSALPDETIYPEDLEELGIPFEFVVTRTWKQACLDHAKKVELVGA